jgi:diguanylate cyclase (GGDEF)-like protein
MFLDLDRFKYVNDTFGHDAGDKLLIDVANRIKAVIKDRDYVFRFGGDEFTVLTHFTEDRQEVTELAKKIIHTLTKPYTFNNRGLSLPQVLVSVCTLNILNR